MTSPFWKFCDLAVLQVKGRDFEAALSSCVKAAEFLNIASNIDLADGRKVYLDSLLNYINNSKARVISQFSDKRGMLDESAVKKFNALKDENAKLRNMLEKKVDIDPLCIVDPTYFPVNEAPEEFGIIVFGFTRADLLKNILDSLQRQDALKYTEVWLDGDQGSPELREKIAKSVEVVKRYPVKYLHTQRGNYGFRKMILLALSQIARKYRDILILEDDCFPTKSAVAEFRRELDEIRDDESIFSVYGHHFGLENPKKTFSRFQGWGWATTSQKLLPVLRQLIDCYSMPENEYLEFVKYAMTDEIKNKIEITPPRLPSYTLNNFFAWDETLCLLTAMNGQTHKPTERRVIYNCGMGDDSAHFREQDLYRKPPFNMISPSEAWSYFEV